MEKVKKVVLSSAVQEKLSKLFDQRVSKPFASFTKLSENLKMCVRYFSQSLRYHHPAWSF